MIRLVSIEQSKIIADAMETSMEWLASPIYGANGKKVGTIMIPIGKN